MTPVETKVYAYAELSENAKQKAREWYAGGDWWNSKDTIDACKEAIKLLGIDAEHIYFRGFNSQGDGACFVGTWRAADLPSRKEFRKEGWRDKELTLLRDRLSMVKQMFPRAWARSTHVGHYCHENSVRVDVELDEEDAVVAPQVDREEIEKRLTEMLRDVMRWIYSVLEKDYEHTYSEEVIAESMAANEYTFTEEGEFFG